MSDDSNIHAEYDGIQEADNHLPRWWLVTLFGAMAFAVVYWQYFHTFKVGLLPNQELAAWEESRAKQVDETPPTVTEEQLVALAAGPAAQEGAALFQTNCAVCHGPQGEGKVGPNLTDSAWLHGGSPLQIHASIHDGWPLKGMLAWGLVLGDAKVKAVTAFVLTLKGTNVPGKAPEGTP